MKENGFEFDNGYDWLRRGQQRRNINKEANKEGNENKEKEDKEAANKNMNNSQENIILKEEEKKQIEQKIEKINNN